MKLLAVNSTIVVIVIIIIIIIIIIYKQLQEVRVFM